VGYANLVAGVPDAGTAGLERLVAEERKDKGGKVTVKLDKEGEGRHVATRIREIVGSVFLRSDVEEVNSVLREFGMIGLLVMAIATVVSWTGATWLRGRIATVLQDVFLFSGDLADNVSLGNPDVDAQAIERAARSVQLHGFIERLPEGYATQVRERGLNFSAGQRQLLSFARALVHGADILVLDEATSAIDTETEALVQEGIHVLMEHKTSLVIAHRLSTIQDVDRIYALHRGRIVESGRHDELLARDGVYARLYRLQYEVEEPTRGRATA